MKGRILLNLVTSNPVYGKLYLNNTWFHSAIQVLSSQDNVTEETVLGVLAMLCTKSEDEYRNELLKHMLGPIK